MKPSNSNTYLTLKSQKALCAALLPIKFDPKSKVAKVELILSVLDITCAPLSPIDKTKVARAELILSTSDNAITPMSQIEYDPKLKVIRVQLILSASDSA
ncbi:hypothetical protein FBU30_009666 [Linnemannia zychae]|nr:hypothetical protein FBU30_009666 [Linnemannia zychae]